MHTINSLNSEVFKYLLVGMLTAVVYFVGVAVLTEFFYSSYRSAVTISYIFSVNFHFFANRKYTFVVDGDLKFQLLRYAGILLVNYLITIFIVIVSIMNSF